MHAKREGRSALRGRKEAHQALVDIGRVHAREEVHFAVRGLRESV
jgi:hypothetical protein